MKQLIATLQVYLDNDADLDQSSATTHQHGTKEWKIILRPATDKKHFVGSDKRSKYDVADVFAHELGHFVGSVMKLPEAIESGKPDATIQQVEAGEKQAWMFAKRMRPVDEELEADALDQYTMVRKHFGPAFPMRLADLIVNSSVISS